MNVSIEMKVSIAVPSQPPTDRGGAVLRDQKKEEDKWEKWKRKRKKTLISYIVVGVVVGIDYSVIFSTLFLYLRDTVKTENPEVYYGIIVAAYSISSSVFGLITGRWLDRTRKIKLFTNLILLLQICGAIFYLIPYHFAFPLVGRFIAGSGDPFINVCTGEVVRIYDEKESTRALWWLASCYSIGMVIGPLLPLVFGGVTFEVGPIPITQYNSMGLFMACLSLLTIGLVNLLMHDCSKELDLKAHLKESGIKEVNFNENECESKDEVFNALQEKSNGMLLITGGIQKMTSTKDTFKCKSLGVNDESVQLKAETLLQAVKKMPSVKSTVVKLMSNFDVALLFISTFICMYSMSAVDVLVPLIFAVYLKWQHLSLVVFFVTSGVVYAVLLFLMAKYCNSSKSLFNSMVVCLTCGALMFLIILAIKLKERDEIIDYVLIVFLGILWLATTCTEEVLIRAILAKKVPSNVQNFTEALRNGISSLAIVVASIGTPLVLSFSEWWALLLMMVMTTLLMFYVGRRKTLSCPQEITFEPADEFL